MNIRPMVINWTILFHAKNYFVFNPKGKISFDVVPSGILWRQLTFFSLNGTRWRFFAKKDEIIPGIMITKTYLIRIQPKSLEHYSHGRHKKEEIDFWYSTCIMKTKLFSSNFSKEENQGQTRRIHYIFKKNY